MGKYLNVDSKGQSLGTHGKAEKLIADGAIEINPPKAWEENLVCVVENGMFEAAGYCYSPEEFRAFSLLDDNRPKTWLLYEKAKELAS